MGTSKYHHQGAVGAGPNFRWADLHGHSVRDAVVGWQISNVGQQVNKGSHGVHQLQTLASKVWGRPEPQRWGAGDCDHLARREVQQKAHQTRCHQLTNCSPFPSPSPPKSLPNLWRFESFNGAVAMPTWTLLLAALCRTEGIQIGEVSQPQSLKVLQWNLHSECFLSCNSTKKPPHCDAHYPSCQQNATSLLRRLLADVDFAGLEQLSDPSFFDQVDSNELGHLQHQCGGSKGYGMYPFDVATIVFSTRWAVKETAGHPLAMSGCMDKVNESSKENDYRAYVGQVFVHKETGLELLVLVAHFPHERKYEAGVEMMAADLAQLKERAKVDQVLLLADTNQRKSNSEIIHDLDPAARKVLGSDVHLTCCYPAYFFQYDRIISSNVESIGSQATALPFGNESAHHVPDWATLHMHDPVLVEFHLVPESPMPHSFGRRSAALQLIPVVLGLAALSSWPWSGS
eukprot:s682_g7.t1